MCLEERREGFGERKIGKKEKLVLMPSQVIPLTGHGGGGVALIPPEPPNELVDWALEGEEHLLSSSHLPLVQGCLPGH